MFSAVLTILYDYLPSRPAFFATATVQPATLELPSLEETIAQWKAVREENRAQLAALKQETRDQWQEVRAENKAQMESFKVEIRDQWQEIREENKSQLDNLKEETRAQLKVVREEK